MSVKLLIADDEDFIRNGMGNYIRTHSQRIDKIFLAANGQEALECIIRYKPDLMLLDVQMPKMDGLEVMEEAQRSGILPKTIILSGFDEFRYAQKAIRYGVEDYMLKPCRSTEIMDRLDKIIDHLEGIVREQSADEHGANRIVFGALAYMNEHYSENLALADVAEKLNITSGYLSTLFSQNESGGFVETLNRIRIEHACTYLHQNHLKTYEIAYKMGFKDEKYFSRVFKKVTGVAPYEYRKINSNR